MVAWWRCGGREAGRLHDWKWQSQSRGGLRAGRRSRRRRRPAAAAGNSGCQRHSPSTKSASSSSPRCANVEMVRRTPTLQARGQQAWNGSTPSRSRQPAASLEPVVRVA